MKCEQNCPSCPFAAISEAEYRNIVVDIVGDIPAPSISAGGGNQGICFLHRGYRIRFVDNTGPDYHIGRTILADNPDIVLNTVDATSLEQSLQLTARLIDMDSRFIIGLGNYSVLLSTGHSIDYKTLGELFGRPAVLLGSGSEEDLSSLLSSIVDVFESPLNLSRHRHIPYGTDLEEAIGKITEIIAESQDLCSQYHDRYLAVRLLEDPQYIYPKIENDSRAPRIAAAARREAEGLEREFGESVEVLVRKARGGFVNGAIQETLRHSKDNSDHTTAQKIDALLTSRWLGLPIMVLVLLGVFAATFSLGAYPQHWIERGVEAASAWLGGLLPSGWLSSLLVDGVVQGVGSVLAFLPNIVILFFFLSFLEDSGYMARAAFTMDKIMHRIGLHGRSFIPMLIGFGCNVPAIMAARSIEDRKDRTLTMLMIPFMSCSARLPVYMLFVSAFFVKQKALIMIGIYAFGVILSILFAFIMKHTRFFRKDQDDFVSELPPFRKPTWRNTGQHIWERVSDYLQKITTVILAASVIIWALEYFPAGKTDGGINKEESCLAMVGKSIEPVMAPLGFDWRMNVCLLTGLPAKEAIVSTMGILYHSSDDGVSLLEAMRRDGGMTPASTLAFMVFVLLYFPCIATVATLRREAGGRWAAFTVVHSLLLAWVAAFIVFRIALLF